MPVDFKPSQVNPVYLGSELGYAGKEIMAGFLVTFLAARGDRWDTPIRSEEFVPFTREPNDKMPDFVQDPFANQTLEGDCARGIRDLMSEGYLKKIEGDSANAVTVQPKLLEFYSKHVLPPGQDAAEGRGAGGRGGRGG